MLRKLIKHEFRATARILLPLFAIVLVLSVGNNLSARVLLQTEASFLRFVGITITGAYMLALFATFSVCSLLIIKRFHSNFLTDEGYVMMTLPVSVHQLICSKLLVSLVWILASLAVLALSALISIFNVEAVQSFLQNMWDFLTMLFQQMDLSNTLLAVESGCYALSGGVHTCLMLYAAMAVGHSFPNYKVLLSIVSYFAMQWMLSLLGYLAMGLFTVMGGDIQSLFNDMALSSSVELTLLAGIGMNILYSGIFYCVTAYFLKRRLNLS